MEQKQKQQLPNDQISQILFQEALKENEERQGNENQLESRDTCPGRHLQLLQSRAGLYRRH